MTMDDNMRAIGKRFSALSDYEVEFDDSGKIQRLQHHYIQDIGCSLNEPGTLLLNYKVHSIKV